MRRKKTTMFITQFKLLLCALAAILGSSLLLPLPAAHAEPKTIGSVQANEARKASFKLNPVGHNKHKGADRQKKTGSKLETRSSVRRGLPLARRAFNAALTRAGKPYSYGAAGPNAFDCSGLTSWAYAQAGKRLPRTSSAQAGATIRVARPQIGDLVFFHNGGNIYHVALWAGPGQVFGSSQSGTPVGRARIWSSSIFFGRVR